ncbi:nucleotidyltransferase family protein [Geminocystis sp. NIES-3709]|uniref:nucleotidyltransferase family protein n=1 Tax=Geminocystis sp. NIES-3709 TaxID=1617448 RepID=UPI0005FCAF61|nr:nucleotidyltransferase family protein [Geminocystis sp. NIES-3709]BAQ64669.1 hypothetical protein GM3709_1434 [Geminocystis sp. NIES-3709]
MIANIYNHQFWPTHEQQLLLKASLLKGEKAINAYREWINLVDIDTLDSESNSLLGLLYRNLIDNKIESQHLPRLKGINRYNWTKNQLFISSFFKIAQVFADFKIDFICFDDLALVSNDYQDYGNKIIKNIGILIKEKNLEKANKILLNLGWQTQNNQVLHNELMWKNDQQQLLCLKYRIFTVEPQEYINEQLWLNTTEQNIAKIPTKILNSVDRFLISCLKANQNYNRLSATKITDAMMIIKNHCNWVDLVNKTQRYELIIPVRNMLCFLSNILEVKIPDWVLSSLFKMPISDYELINYRIPASHRELKLKSLFLRIGKLLIKY